MTHPKNVIEKKSEHLNKKVGGGGSCGGGGAVYSAARDLAIRLESVSKTPEK